MSTPSETNPELVELSDYLPPQLREQVSLGTEQPLASEEDPPRSPYAPKPAAERAAARLRLLAAEGSDAQLQPAPSEIRRRILADHELARIEASLRLLQRQQNPAPRLPRAPNLCLPEQSGLGAGHGASGPEGEKILEWLARPRSLKPTIMPPAPLKPARKLRVSWPLAVICFAGAGICLAFLSPRSLPSAAITQTISAAPSFGAPPSYSAESSQREAFSRTDDEWQYLPMRSASAQLEPAPIEASAADAASPVTVMSARHSLAKADISQEENAALPQIGPTAPALRPEDIDVLIAQGEKFMADGDVVTARLIFGRAAKAENARAALALAAAYDPAVLAKLGVLGVDTDVEKARRWYQKAQSLGSTQAMERLRALAER